ncbi:Vacuolar protein sorting-associated protein 35 [Aphelenchoides besseyi]|nr:Vacuolar protein sorting-associated protein 35 [Aphelenchoides besseyi]KAI6194407.1 Vacuolar protein sorting-associated protein 35 [Aphelenchoides besseyi]
MGSETEQEQLLEETIRVVKTQAFEMKRCLDRKEIMEGFRFANVMLAELRSTALSPKFYYRLYIDVTNELQHFLSFLEEEYLNGDSTKKVAELYEFVQFAGSIVPRLYLMITVGIVYIKSKEAPRKDILRDMVEMCRGVQHPLKGLFLRNYLLTSTKELLPIGAPGTEQSEEDGDIRDALDVVMINFSEMNKLWVRMQHQGPTKERDKRERERRELRILVGTNLVRLAQLELLDLEMYKEHVLPGILEQAVSCKEPISQEYLMECVIQVFPDEFHLATLSEFLTACAELNPSVQIKNVLCAIIDRLAIYAVAEDGPGIPSEIDLFQTFSTHAEKIIAAREEILPEDIVSIQKALANLAIKCYPSDVSFADMVFKSTVNIFNQLKLSNIPFNGNLGRELMKLLKLPIENYGSCLEVFDMNSYIDLMNCLHYRGRTSICSFLIRRIIESNSYVETEEALQKLFNLLETLIVDQEDQPEDLENNEDFDEEQSLVARLLHVIRNEDRAVHFTLLSKARKVFGKGGKYRFKYTLPPTIFAVYKLAASYAEDRESDEWDERMKKIFHFCMSTISALKSETESHELCLKLLLQGSLIADKLAFEDSASVTYEFISNAFTIYEEDLSESRIQIHCLNQMIGTVQQIRGLLDENHGPLQNQCAMYATRLLKKPDQARALCLVAHLCWNSQLKDSDVPTKDGARVLECLKKAIKVSSQCMEDAVQLTAYVHILSNYLHFYELGCEQITSVMVNQLIDKIRDSLLHLDSSNNSDQLNETFATCIAHARQLKESTDDTTLANALEKLNLN